MAEILTRTYTYTGKSSWTAGKSAVTLSQFTVSGDTRPITQIMSISASWWRYQDTSSTVTHAAELAFADGSVLKSNSVSHRGDGDIFQVDASFMDMPGAAAWVEANITLRTTLTNKLDHVYWRATASQPMVLTITYNSSEFKPNITNAKLYRANSLGAAADDGTYLSFTAKLTVEKLGTSGSGTFKIYSGGSADATTTRVYSSSVSGSTSGKTVSAAPISGLTVGSGEKKGFRMEFSYTALTDSGASSTETVSATFLIGNVFTNVHLAGVSTGGVRFGGYSTAGEGTPKFECDYPAYLYGGIAQIGNGSGSLLELMGVQTGSSAAQSVTNSKTATVDVVFARSYKEAPVVVANIVSESDSYYLGRCNVAIQSVSTTGFTARLANGGSAAVVFGFNWAAFGTLASEYTPVIVTRPQGAMTSNSSLSCEASASTEFSSGYPAWCAFDASPATSWACVSSESAPWIQLKMDVALKNIQVSVYSRSQNPASGNHNPTAGTVQGSNDGSNWTQIGSYSGWSEKNDGTLLGTISCGNTTAYKYVRLNISSRAGSEYATIGYISIRGEI